MKKYTVYGNCQARILPRVLNSSKIFKSTFEYVDIKAVHMIRTEEIDYYIDQVLPHLDLFIFQPVSEKYNNNERYSTNFLLSKLKSDAISISFPSCYFNGYTPEIKHTKLIRDGVNKDEFDYHDKNMMKYFLSEANPQPQDFILNDKFYSEEFSLQAVEESLKELERRESSIFGSEKQIDIKVSKFIRDNYQKERLFHTVNHPSKPLFIYLGKAILDFLTIKDEVTFLKDPLAHTVYPIYESHYQNLQLKFSNSLEYKIENQDYNPTKIIEKYLEYYREIPREIIEKSFV
ncbi:WcbI family polysaccharide biosynthesis putative acetyltransferase [Pleurocapsa sp. CCALA 161]|uniref:WcbI family polysaccharide biosynthesis putative acetyltransferase n=1 Tax=Pleurocapsa sp. CCALA 161 TaxID=2107688 RepID=UPI0011B298D1|nr:WcbI family polysaccharide biosynthesis putative acetyltransferase [Pleurocapsa sp. CCALA 161]